MHVRYRRRSQHLFATLNLPAAVHHQRQRRESLLPVEHLAAFVSVVLPDERGTWGFRGRFPDDDGTDGIAVDDGINEIPNIFRVPNELPLDRRDTEGWSLAGSETAERGQLRLDGLNFHFLIPR